MKLARKTFTLLLALALMLSLAVPAMADDTATTPTYTVTITGHKAGHTYEAYQIFGGSLDSTGAILSNITWGAGIKGGEFLSFLTSEATGLFSETRVVDGKESTINNVFAGCQSAEDVAKVLSGYADKDKMLDTFAKYAGKYLITAQGTSSGSEGTTYTISTLPAGYYLIKDMDDTLANSQDDFYTKFMLEVVANVPVSVKGSVPSVEKTTADTADGTYGETTTAMIGETVYFELTATLPSNFEIYDDYYFTFNDTMSKGLTFKQIEQVYVQRANEKATIPAGFIDADLKTEGNQSIVATTKGENGSTNFEIKIGDLKAEGFPALLLENKIVVRYSATLNENAVIASTGNPNEVTLDYSNNPYDDGEGTTGPDEVTVFTFGLDIDKHDKADTSKKLAGAEFVLYRREVYTAETAVPADDGAEAQATELLKLHFAKVVDGKAAGWITVDNIAPAATPALTWEVVKNQLGEDKLASITLTTDTNGKIKVAGLDIHTYHMLEIKAPDGYNLPRDPFVVIMTPTTDENGNVLMSYQYGSGEAVVSGDGYAAISVANGKGNTLPSTGGMGTTLFYVIGGLMVAGAAVLLVTKKRMSEV